MSKKPYIVQENSPNLVIVTTDHVQTFYEPPPKKVEENEAQLTPTPSSSYPSVFARKNSAKLNCSSINNDVLIDVRKVQRSPKSWATNFLQSIGGPSTKFDRIYSLAPNQTSLLRDSTIQPKNNKETTPTSTINQQLPTNTKSAPQIMEKKTCQPKININLIKPKPAPQPTMIKEANKTNCNVNNNTSSKPTDVRKEPALPKNYKIPMQSKYNKLPTPVTDKETIKPTSSNSINLQNSITSKNNTTISSYKNNQEFIRPNDNKIAISNNTTSKDTDLNKKKEPIQLKHDLSYNQCRNRPDKAQENKNTAHIKHSYETKLKTNKVTAHPIIRKHAETAQPVNNKENNQPKHKKGIIQRKAVKEALPRNHKDNCPQRDTSLKTNEDIIAHIKAIKKMYTLKKKQEPSYSTKLKTKKEHVSVSSSNVSKLEKQSIIKDNQNNKTRYKKHKDESATNIETHSSKYLLTKSDIIAKLKNKRALENKASQGEYSSSKTKRIRLSSPDTNTNAAKNKISKSINEERLSKSTSPIKSVVSRIRTDQPFQNTKKQHHKESDYYHSHYDKTLTKSSDYSCQNSEKHFQRGSNVDLRTKLKRKNPKSDYRKDVHKLSYTKKKDKFSTVHNSDRFLPEENLIISFNAENDSEATPKMKKSPVKKLGRKLSSPKDKKCKKIKLEINIVFGHDDTTDDESTKSEAEKTTETIENMDLSFLDDFNVDEIAESLNECKDCTRKSNEETEVDINVQDSLPGVNTKIDTNAIKDIRYAENKLENYQETALPPTDTKHSLCYDESQNSSSIIGTGVDNNNIHQGINNEIKTELYQANNSIDTRVRTSIPDLLIENTTTENSSSPGQSFVNITIDKAQEFATTDNKNDVTQFKNISKENERIYENSLQLVTKTENTDLITYTANEKQNVRSSKIPAVRPHPESNIYSDNNDIIDALQDNSNLEINAIKSYIASLNNNTNDQSKFNQTDVTSTQDKTRMLACIKEDPDVILIDDSDTENETEIKKNPLMKAKNTKDVKSGNKSLSDKSDEVIIIEPAGENSEPILILDTNAETSQAVKKSRFDKSEKTTTIGPAGENSEPILILDTNTETSQAVKESRMDKSDDVTIIEPAVENSEPKLILDTNTKTSQAVKKSRWDKLDELTIIDPASKNSRPILILDKNADTSQPANESQLNKSDEVTMIEPASEDSDTTFILDTSAEDLQPGTESQLDKQVEEMIVEPSGQNSVLVLDIGKSISTPQINKIDQNTNSNNKILPEQSKTDKETPEDASIETKTSTNAAKDSKKHATKEIGPEKAKTELHNNKDDSPNKATVASKIDQQTSDESPSKKTTENEGINVKCTSKTTTANTKTQNVNTKRDTKTHSKESSETHSENKEKVPKNSENKEKVPKNSENKGAEKSLSLANNKFVQVLQAKLAPFMGQKCTITDVIRYDGRFSKIYRCKDADKQDYAIKTLKKQCDGFNKGLLKQNMMLELQNGVPETNLNCVRYITGLVVSGLWCFVMEYFPMNLQQALVKNNRSFHIDDVQILSRQLVSAVTILRNNNIIHSDIKPSHILINSSQTRIKLCGFDQAAYFEDINLLPNTGTINYRAPELILGYPAGYEIDVWSTALVMYEMATRRKLFFGAYNNNILYQQLCTLGAIPMEMLMESRFRNAHFSGTAFMRIYGKNEKCIVEEIEFNDKLDITLFKAYTVDWGKTRQANKREDQAKIRALSELLHNMLAMHPRCRLAIEFVFANPFIYESFDNC